MYSEMAKSACCLDLAAVVASKDMGIEICSSSESVANFSDDTALIAPSLLASFGGQDFF
jgi:hypothetical protein